MLGWVIRLLLIALVLRVIIGFLSGFFGSRETSDLNGGGRRKGTTLVRDPVCGTYVEPSHAVSTRAGATVHYFCSKRCQQTFSRS